MSMKADNTGHTPMYAASYSGHLEVINGFMIMVKDDVTKADNHGQNTTMYAASSNGHLEVIKWLYDHGERRCYES